MTDELTDQLTQAVEDVLEGMTETDVAVDRILELTTPAPAPAVPGMILEAKGRSIAAIRWNPSDVAGLRREQLEHLAYHIARLLAGERTAVSEWDHLGVSIGVEECPSA